MERWKDIKGFEGIAQVSSYGRVRNIQRNRHYTPQNNGVGYLKVGLWKDGKTYKAYIHRLVADAFLPNPSNLSEVNHIDSNRANNRVENLEWVSSSGNTIHAMRKRRLIPWGNVPKAIIAEKDGRVLEFETISQAERHFGSRHIIDVLKGRRQHCCGWSFSYAEGGDQNVLDNHRRAKCKTEDVSA